MIAETIVAPATAEGKAGLSVIRVSGEKSHVICLKLTKNKVNFIDREPVLSPIFFKESIIDRALITFFKAPRSYTGEDVFEISCHGSPIIVKSILNALCEFGARTANPGEFTLRSFLSGKIDLIQAESVASIIESESILSSIAHNKILSGSLSKKINEIKSLILLLISIVEFELDISENETHPETHKKLSKLIKNSVLKCEKLLENYSENRVSFYSRVVLCGEPNVGKSTLLNSLLGQERAIVSSTPGTTRDRIEVDLDLAQTRITLIDTAGTRETENNVEKSGIEKTLEAIKSADILIHVVTSDSKLPNLQNNKVNILVFNKSDKHNVPDRFSSAIKVSALKEIGINSLKDKLKKSLRKSKNNYSDGFLATQRQFNHLLKCSKYLKKAKASILKRNVFEPELISIDLKDSLSEIDCLLGKTSFDDIFDSVFSNFCVGK
jgi:tRNA modification GTPase